MPDEIAPWLVSAKVSPPRQLVSVCRRQSLLQQLKRNDQYHTVWIEAPAGYGKTLLASQWREELLKNRRHVGWLTIDSNDDPDIFIPYLAFSLHLSGLDMLSTRLLLPSFQGIRTAYSLGRLLHRIELSEQPVALIFDDCENASAELITKVFEPLLGMQPENLCVVFICRKNPGLSLSALSVQGRLLTIGPHQLAFNADEITEFFGGNLDKRQQLEIAEITGGWPVALQLLRSFGALDTNPDRINRKEINDYLKEQLVDKLPDDEKEFLLEVAVLNSVSANCADEIRLATDSNDMIKRLSYLGGIIGPLEDNSESYRIHPLVREFLLTELQDTRPEKFLLLNERYAGWLARNSLPIDAIRAALAAQQVDLAVEIFTRIGGLQLFLREGMPRLRMAMELFCGLELENYPRIQLARSLIYAKNGQIKKANDAFAVAVAGSSGNGADQDDTALMIDRFIVEICLIEYGCTPAANVLSRDSLKYIMEYTAHDPAIHGCIATMQCLLHLQAGSFERCVHYGLDAIANLTGCHQSYGVSHIHFHLGMAALAGNRLQQAQSHYDEAITISRTHFPGDTGLIFIGDVVTGELCWELGDRHTAGRHIKRIISHPKNVEAWFDLHMAAYQTTAQYILEDAGLDAALLFLDREDERSKAEGLTRLSKYLHAVRFLIHYLADDNGAAMAYCSDRIDAPAIVDQDSPQSTWREIEILTLAQIRIALLNTDTARADFLIAALLQYAEQTGNTRVLLYGMVQRAILENQTAGRPQALLTLAEALKRAGHNGYLRPFLQERHKLSGLLAAIAQDRRHPAGRNTDKQVVKTANDLVNLISASGANENEAPTFNDREIEILVELAKGQPDKLIGKALGISAHGVRYHLKNIYFKMGVENRLQAICKAQQNGIIPRPLSL